MVKNLIWQKKVNIATEFNDILIKKKIRHKMRKIQGKKHKWEDTKSTKHHYLFLMIKDLL